MRAGGLGWDGGLSLWWQINYPIAPPPLDERCALPYEGRLPAAQVAQSVEQRIENPRVGGSIPPLGTIKSKT